MKLEITKEQLELLEFMIQEFEYQDDEERALIEGIEAQIYDVKEQDLVRVIICLTLFELVFICGSKFILKILP